MTDPLSAFTALPPDWQAWIRDNLARACSPAEMADSMARSGQYSLQAARAAIALAPGCPAPAFAAAPAQPYIDTDAAALRLDGRDVELLFVLRQPVVVLLGGVLDDAECAAMQAHCAERYSRSTVTPEEDGRSAVHAGRTSDMAYIARGDCAVADRVEQRLAALAHWPLDRGEPFQLQRYGVGNEYRAHFDWLNPDAAGHREHLARGGQRLATFILYLGEVERGGATVFPKLGLEVFPRKGSALFFLNTDATGQPDPRTLHAGAPVLSGSKVIANKWLRAGRY
ncbi:2OG-Fe(II) oxygenase [Rugamonas sp. CCM 8940]|uniref:2OG-Fe(II) oxygenase n=1 Tax=Rugamonas sp. CCM 8940 TaxID=2765359 RepID=UPI0018F542E1|nr:2OG-Fe(II) oxygenase [Rugamonas sp. CCM 8940]MBJ7313414.1 2OG-Fe(II) oxygenase [Rugamonas sp. CCM 8940]